MAFNSKETASFHIGNTQLEETTEYTYLGIKIHNTNDSLAKHEAAVVAKSSKLKEKVRRDTPTIHTRWEERFGRQQQSQQ